MTEEEIFHEALARRPEERAAYLDEACAGDSSRRASVEALLRANVGATGFLEQPAAEFDTTRTAGEPISETPGTMIGPYKLLEQIGEGGFGVVYLAEQTEPVRRKVALKILKPGMDTRQIVARFEAERQALAIMDHPNIAKVFDGGSTGCVGWVESSRPTDSAPRAVGLEDSTYPTISGGRPFFVMELVKGIPITDYCDQNHLTPRQRLELFIPVCQAVQHAHQKGIIHRDLKPSNVLVTRHDPSSPPLGKGGRGGVPKVIDFGVAKALGQELTDKTLHTGIAQMIGTPLYMSPEQAGMSDLDVDTRSDIYSLGVLLYELLTGTTPFEKERFKKAAYDEIRRIIRDEEPPKPSTRLSDLSRSRLPGGTAGSPARQAGPTSSLASVSALRQTEPAKLTKLIRGELDWIVMKALDKDRNRRYETANGFAADVQRYLADEAVQACPPSAWYRLRKFGRRNKTALTMATVVVMSVVLAVGGLGWVVRDRSIRQEQTAQSVGESLTRARRWIDKHDLASARQELAEARGRLGGDSIALRDMKRELEDLSAELDAHVEAQNTFRDFFEFIDQANERETSSGRAAIGRVYTYEQRDPREAIPLILRALALYRVIEEDDWSARLQQQRLESDQRDQIRRAVYEKLLWLAEDVRRRQEEHLSGADLDRAGSARRALAYLKKAEAMASPTRALFWIRSSCWEQLGDQQAAKADAQRAREAKTVMAIDHFLVGQAAYFAAMGAARAEKKAEGIREFEAALRLEPSHYWSLMWLGWCLVDRGEGQERAEAARVFTGCIALRPRHAHAYYCRAIALMELGLSEKALADFDAALALKPDHVMALHYRGRTYMKLRRYDRALPDLTRAVRFEPRDFVIWGDLGISHEELGEIDKALAAFAKSAELSPSSDQAQAHHRFGLLLCEYKHDFDGAIAAFQAAIRIDPKNDVYHDHLGVALNNKGMLKESLAAHQEAVRINPLNRHAHFGIGLAFEQLGQIDPAIAAYRKAIEVNPGKVLAYRHLGVLLHNDKRDSEGAVAAFRKALELEPNHAATYANLGNALRRLKKLNEAVAAYRESTKRDPRNATTYHNLGLALNDQKKFEEAIAAFHKAIDLDSKYVSAHLNLGRTYWKQGKLDEAVACYHKAAELNTNQVLDRQQLAEMLVLCPDPEIVDPRLAVEYARKVAESHPDSTMGFQVLGWAQYRAGDWRGCIESLEKSCKLQDGGTGDFGQWIVMTLAHARLAAQEGLTDEERAHHKAAARRLYEKAGKQIDNKWRARPGDNGFGQAIWDFRAEARKVMNPTDGKK